MAIVAFAEQELVQIDASNAIYVEKARTKALGKLDL